MPTESASRRDRRGEQLQRKRARERPSTWIALATGLGAAVLVGGLSRLAGPEGSRYVMFVSAFLALACAVMARRWEQERTRENTTWMVLVGLAGGFAAAAGYAMREDPIRGVLVAIGTSLLVGVIVGKAPARQRGERSELR